MDLLPQASESDTVRALDVCVDMILSDKKEHRFRALIEMRGIEEIKKVMILCDTDRKILHRLQSNLPLVSRPFLELSKELGIDEDTIIERIKFMIEKGYVRRLAPIINTQAMGRKPRLPRLKSRKTASTR